jgi:REP element-mobilizing transposase RayT
MTRKREEWPGALWHVTARGVLQVAIFRDDLDYELYIRLLGEVTVAFGWVLLVFCLMPNHVHLLIETPEPNLADGMYVLQFKYAMHVKRRYGHQGHVFDARYHPQPVETELHFICCTTYIAANPARARLCRSPADYPWSSLGLVTRNIALPWVAHEELCERFRGLTGRRPFEEWIG